MSPTSVDAPSGDRADRRIPALDVTRAVALVGVVVMNFHGYLNGDGRPSEAVERLLDVSSGVLSGRFAAVFVLVAGVAITVGRPEVDGNPVRVSGHRRRLLRRGAVLMLAGMALDHAWPGTIIFYYGVYFILASTFFNTRTRTIVSIGATSAVGAAVIATWEAVRRADGHSTAWLHPGSPDDPRDFLLRTMVDHTHPVLPWLAFLCVGMVIGRYYTTFARRATTVALTSIPLTAVVYAAVAILDSADLRGGTVVHALTSMQPFRRGLLFTTTTIGIAVTSLALVVAITERAASASLDALRRTGQLTLSLYLCHVVVFYVVTRWTHLVEPGRWNGLMLGIVFWIIAVPTAAGWHRRYGRGPAERLYRLVGG